MKRLITTTLGMAFAVLSLHATTIAPFKNLGEMAKHTSVVVVAKAIENYEVEVGETTRFRTRLVVVNSIKGGLEIGEEISVQNMKTITNGYTRTISGDLNLSAGETYFLFLEIQDGVYLPKILSYGALKKDQYDEINILIPIGLGTETKFIELEGPVEPLEVYNFNNLLNEITAIVDNSKSWNLKRVKFRIDKSILNTFRMDPPHCNYFTGSDPRPRWENAESSAVPVYYHEDGDPDFPTTTSTIIQNVVNEFNSGYTGVALSNNGSHDYEPSSGCTTATGSGFQSYMNTTIGTSRAILIQFDDPCDEVETFSPSGSRILAVGGFAWFSSTYSYLGTNYHPAAFGSIIVNEGSGAFQGVADYTTMLVHEITHAVGLGHIPTSAGLANMNGTCCNDISSLDVECVSHLYPLAAMPIQLGDFTGEDLDGQVLLSWKSLSETNNDYYTIEKMQEDGSFKNIGTVQGVGNTTEEQLYEFVDLSSVGGVNTYRLSQTDYDGHMRVLKAIQVDVSSSSDLVVYPNPLNGSNLNIRFSAARKTNYHVEILDIVGKTVYSENLVLGKGNHVETVEMNEVSGNLFFVKVTEGSTTKVIKVIR